MRRNALHLLRPTPSIPEPETYATLLAGPGLMGLMARCRKQKPLILLNPATPLGQVLFRNPGQMDTQPLWNFAWCRRDEASDREIHGMFYFGYFFVWAM
ncbi:MAG: PEP-CTERM sorting domain-containing protein [Nitrosospira sp.]